MTLSLSERIEHDFSFHPATEVTGPKHALVRDVLKQTAHYLAKSVPEGRELSLCLTKLEEALMWANAGIARNQPQ